MLQANVKNALLEALKITGEHPAAGTTVEIEMPCKEEWVCIDNLYYHKIAEVWRVEFGAMNGNKQLYYITKIPCYDSIKGRNK